jgi:hypothetical protein
MSHVPFRRNRMKLLISGLVLSAVLIVAAVQQRSHSAVDPFAPDQTRARSNNESRPVFGSQPDAVLPPKPVAPATEPEAAPATHIAAEDGVPADILGFLEKWRSTLVRKDLDGHVGTYAPRVDKFFRKRRVTRDQVRAEKSQMIAKYPDINKYELKDVRLTSQSKGRAVVTFRKDWDTSGRTRFAGSEQQRLTLRKFGGAWLITGEEELKVHWVRRG